MSISYKEVNNQRIAFRSMGQGAPIILLHASPLSSQSMTFLMERLATNYLVIAPDTPGYGDSDIPEHRPDSIAYYSDAINAFCEAMDIGHYAIYGTATGAQIAIRCALSYPDRVSHLFLDNCAHFTDGERAKILESYFPDFSVKEDGSHLAQTWQTIDGLFRYFPWCFKSPEYKLNMPTPPLPVYDNMMYHYLKSGARYDWAYKVAFEHEDKKHIESLDTPTTIFRWESSILKKYTDRIFEGNTKDNIKSLVITKEENRYDSMARHIIDSYQSDLSISSPTARQLNENNGLDINVPFPDSTADGSHWLRAWETIKSDDSASQKSKEEINQDLITWSRKHFKI